MKRVFGFALLVLLMWCMLPSSASADAPSAELLQQALQRYIMFDICWRDGNELYRVGSVGNALVTLDSEKGYFHIWSDALIEKGAAPTISLYKGRFKDDKAIVLSRESYSETSVDAEGDKRLFAGSNAMKLSVHVPSECNYRDGDDKKLKINLTTGILDTFVQFFSRVNHDHPGKYPDRLKIVIADFHAYYPSTFVYIKDTGAVYEVSLGGSSEPYLDGYEPSVDNTFMNKYLGRFGSGDPLVKKIMKHGIVRSIKLDTDNIGH